VEAAAAAAVAAATKTTKTTKTTTDHDVGSNTSRSSAAGCCCWVLPPPHGYPPTRLLPDNVVTLLRRPVVSPSQHRDGANRRQLQYSQSCDVFRQSSSILTISAGCCWLRIDNKQATFSHHRHKKIRHRVVSRRPDVSPGPVFPL